MLRDWTALDSATSPAHAPYPGSSVTVDILLTRRATAGDFLPSTTHSADPQTAQRASITVCYRRPIEMLSFIYNAVAIVQQTDVLRYCVTFVKIYFLFCIICLICRDQRAGALRRNLRSAPPSLLTPRPPTVNWRSFSSPICASGSLHLDTFISSFLIKRGICAVKLLLADINC